MTTMTVQLRSIPDTKAALGWAGGHTIVVDRPDGKAGGLGLGFNGGQLLGLAIGGCFCNDLQYVAHDMGILLASVQVAVSVTFEGTPMFAKEATMQVAATPVDQSADIDAVIARAKDISSVSNSLRRGIPVQIISQLSA
jgi:organic hydroperoxide reductase OsmC/OhrA